MMTPEEIVKELCSILAIRYGYADGETIDWILKNLFELPKPQQPEQDICPRCEGSGNYNDGKDCGESCPICHGTGRVPKADPVRAKFKTHTKFNSEADPVDELAQLLDEPRAVRLLAEWIAIDHNETRLEFEKYMEPAQSLYDYLVILRFKLVPKADNELTEKVEEIVDHVLSMEALIVLDLDKQKVEALKDWSDAQVSANYTLRETTINQIIALIEGEIRKQEREAIIRCITDAKRVHPDWGIADILELLGFREETREAMKNQSGDYISLEEVRKSLKEREEKK